MIFDTLKMAGRFHVQHYRRSRLINQFSVPNGIVDQGIHHIMETEFRGGAQIGTWYIGLVSGSTFGGLSDADTMLTSSRLWTEEQNYSGNRPLWVHGSAASRTITNTSPSNFFVTADFTRVNGLFVCSDSLRGGTSGVLWSTALFPAQYVLSGGDLLEVNYILNG